MTAHGSRPQSLTGLALTLALLLAPTGRVEAQISPGPLAKAHASLEGARNCAQCHGLRREPMNDLCLGCHKEVRALLDQRRGFHAREMRVGTKTCAGCHPDHAGADFSLVAWPDGSAERFNHTRAGWTLDGKHASATCESCHTPEFRTSAVAALSKRRSGAGWLGLDPDCASCHTRDDVHGRTLGTSCGSCHDARSWTSAPKFDHARSNYPLTGQHVDVSCDKCHLAPRLNAKLDARGRRVPVFKPVPFKECSSCHTDPHRGRLSGTCTSCHVTRGFRVVDRKEFDHSLTRYRLEGRHAGVRCEACHGNKLERPSPPFATCGSCHADTHRGEAALAGRPADCAACHTVTGFTPSTYTANDHQRAKFALGGKHRQVKCASCHVAPAPSAGSLRGRPEGIARFVPIRVAYDRCSSCHVDAHGGQFTGRAGEGSCEGCHSDAAWKPSTFPPSTHGTLRVTLTGRHGTIPCASCHATSRPGLPPVAHAGSLGRAQVLFAGIEAECGSCHVDAHAGRYAKGGARPTAGGCASCHTTRAFRPASVDVAMHNQFAFALDGAHRTAPCVACHEEFKGAPAASTLVRAARGVPTLTFASTRSTTCAQCHQTPHGAQFDDRPGRGGCEGCHGTASFAPAVRFNHDRDSRFPLAGAHASVSCASCHPPGAGATPQQLRFRGIARTCEGCHGQRTPARPPRRTP